MQAEYRKLRSAAHADERAEFERLSRDPTFRHFLALCISERAASDIGPIEIRSADPEVVTLAAHWLRRLSNGRVDFGTGRSSTRMELEGFGIHPSQTRDMWQEALGHVVGCWTNDE